MKFYAEPNMYVRIAQKNLRNGRKLGFHFNENGEYETDDPRLIERMKVQFSTTAPENIPVSEPEEEPEEVEVEEVIEEPEEAEKEVKLPTKTIGKPIKKGKRR